MGAACVSRQKAGSGKAASVEVVLTREDKARRQYVARGGASSSRAVSCPSVSPLVGGQHSWLVCCCVKSHVTLLSIHPSIHPSRRCVGAAVLAPVHPSTLLVHACLSTSVCARVSMLHERARHGCVGWMTDTKKTWRSGARRTRSSTKPTVR